MAMNGVARLATRMVVQAWWIDKHQKIKDAIIKLWQHYSKK